MSVLTQADDSVLLNYDKVTISYSYTDDILGIGSLSPDLDFDMDAIGLKYTNQFDSIIVGGGLTYGRFDGVDDEILNGTFGLGKIFKLNDDLNLIGGLQLDYIDVRKSYSTNALTLMPSLTFDSAISDKIGVTVQVGWIEDLDAELGGVDVSEFLEGTWAIGLSTTYALQNNVGLHLGVNLNEDGFNTPSIGLSYNW